MPSVTRSLASKRFLRGAWRQYFGLSGGEALRRSLVRGGASSADMRRPGKRIGSLSASARVRVADTSSGGRFWNGTARGTEMSAPGRDRRGRADRHARRGVFVRRYAFSASSEKPAKRDQAVARRGRFVVGIRCYFWAAPSSVLVDTAPPRAMTSAALPRVFTTHGGSPRFFMSDDGSGMFPADLRRPTRVFSVPILVFASNWSPRCRCSPPDGVSLHAAF